MIYADHNAGAPLADRVRAALRELDGELTNPSASHAAARRLRRRIDSAREIVAASLGVAPSEIVFTSGATESTHTAVRAALVEGGARRIVTSPFEHAATSGAVEQWGARCDAPVCRLPAAPSGAWRADELAALAGMEPDRRLLVTLTAANSESGVISPVHELRAAMPTGALAHVDAVQLWGKVALDVSAWRVDYASFSGHKIGALAGVGVLYVRRGSPTAPLLSGGGQERGLRAGTENALGILSLGWAAAELDWRLRQMPTVRRARDAVQAAVTALPGVCALGGEPRLPNTLLVHVAGVDSEDLLLELESRGVVASAGSACATLDSEPSPTLLAMGLSAVEASECVRFSFGPDFDEDQADAVVQAFRGALADSVRRQSNSSTGSDRA